MWREGLLPELVPPPLHLPLCRALLGLDESQGQKEKVSMEMVPCPFILYRRDGQGRIQAPRSFRVSRTLICLCWETIS